MGASQEDVVGWAGVCVLFWCNGKPLEGFEQESNVMALSVQKVLEAVVWATKTGCRQWGWSGVDRCRVFEGRTNEA